MCDPVSAGIALGGISAIGGIIGSKSSKKLQKEALAIQRDTLDFAKKRYSDYKTTYGDLEQMVVDSAKKGVVADLSGVTTRAAADVSTQFAGAEEARIRNDQRMGINPNSGRAEAGARKNSLFEALAKAGNITSGRETERRDANQKTWDRQYAVNQIGVNQMNNAAGEVTNANNAIANTYSTMAAQKAQQAGQLFSTAGTVAGMGLSGGFGGEATPTVAPAAPPTLLAARSPATPAYVPQNQQTFNSLYSAIKP